MPYKIKQIIFKDQPKVSVEGQIVFERQCGMYYSGVYSSHITHSYQVEGYENENDYHCSHRSHHSNCHYRAM